MGNSLNSSLTSATNMERPGVLKDFPPVIPINAEGMLAASINQFEEAIAAANANASAGVATDIKQTVGKQGGNVLVNVVSMQDCKFEECTNLTEMVGKQGCAFDGNTAADCKEHCDKVNANDADAECMCPDALTCGAPMLNMVWNDACSRRFTKETCTVGRSMGGRLNGTCEWVGNKCQKKTDCSVVTQAGAAEGAGCAPPLAAEAFFKKNQLRACWGEDSDEHRGCIHGDHNDPMAPTVANGCLGLCVVGGGSCSDGASLNEDACAQKSHTWTEARCSNGASKKQSKCKGTWIKASCSDGVSNSKTACESKRHLWTPSCPSDDDTERLPRNPALGGTTAHRRMLLCQDFAEKNYPFEALQGTEEDKYQLDYYDSLMLASNPIDTCARMDKRELCGKNPQCMWKSGKCLKSPEYATSVLTSICDTMSVEHQCAAHPDCKWNGAGRWCEVNGDKVKLRRQNLKDSIDRRVDQNTKDFCYEKTRIDKSRSGYKRVCHRMLAGEDIDDAQTCPPGFNTLPKDAFGIVHESPTSGDGAEGAVCLGGPCDTCASSDVRLCQKHTEQQACEDQQHGICNWHLSTRTNKYSCVDVPCHERTHDQCQTNCVWNTDVNVCEGCIMARDQNMATVDGSASPKNPVTALAPLKLTNMTYGGQCTIENITQINEASLSRDGEQVVEKMNHSLNRLDMAAIRQALRGAGAAAMGGFGANKESEARSIAKQTQDAAVKITNEVSQACGQKGGAVSLLANLVGESCINTRKCEIDGVDQRNSLEKIETCVQNISVGNDMTQNMLNRINQLAVESATGTLRGALIDTVVWGTVVLGSVAALVAWVVGGPSSSVATLIMGTTVVAGLGMYLWLPSRRDAATAQEFVMHGSVKRRPGDYTKHKYNPLPEACGMQPYDDKDIQGGYAEAYGICKDDPYCKTFFFKADSDRAKYEVADCSEPQHKTREACEDNGETWVGCTGKSKQRCTADPKCVALPKKTWTDRWYGFLSHTSGTDGAPHIHLVQELLRDTADVGDMPDSTELAELLDQGKTVSFEADGPSGSPVKGTVTGISTTQIDTDEPMVKKLTYGTRIVLKTGDFGICSDGTSTDKTTCLADVDCVSGPPTDKFESDCKLNMRRCPAECATNPFVEEGKRKGELKYLCQRCCEAKAGTGTKNSDCQPYADFVGGRRTLQCSSCKAAPGKMWMYYENAGAQRACSDPQYTTREACEKHGNAWARCIAGLDQPHMVTGDQLQCFDRAERWLGYAAPKYPYAKAGKALAIEAAAWGVGAIVAVLLAHIVCSNIPGLNKAMGLVD